MVPLRDFGCNHLEVVHAVIKLCTYAVVHIHKGNIRLDIRDGRPTTHFISTCHPLLPSKLFMRIDISTAVLARIRG